MKTAFRTDEANQKAFLELAKNTPCINGILPERFKKVMTENRGVVSEIDDYPAVGDGLERRNPLIVALGDSVTAGHFEFTFDDKKIEKALSEKIFSKEELDKVYKKGPIDFDQLIAKVGMEIFEWGIFSEIIDVRESYLDKFRDKLIDKYEMTSLSVINSGIAGDTILGMQKRLDRDVISHDPDLVLINGSLNWQKSCGSKETYERALRETVIRLKRDTKADIVLMTPNGVRPGPFGDSEVTLDERVACIREIAAEQSVCLVDTYKIWQKYEADGHSLKPLLANGGNHPSTTGQEVFAIALMQLFAS